MSQSGIQALQSEVEAIANAPTLTYIHEVCSFLELLKYYGKFVHHLSTMVQPLSVSLSGTQEELELDQ